MIMALKSVLRLTAEPQCTLDRNESLWGLVATIANNKIKKQVEYYSTLKNDVRKEQPMDRDSDGVSPEPASTEPTPEEIAQWADTLQVIRGRLNPESFVVLALKLEGLTDQEIADQLGVTRHTISNKRKRIWPVIKRIVAEDE